MKKSIPVILFVFIAAILMLFISDFKFKPLDTLMKPPKVVGENHAIQLAFEASVDDGYRLIAPVKGNNHAAFTFFDLDNDRKEEVVVFYSKTSDIDLVRMNVLACDSTGNWNSIADFESTYSEVQQVEFADLNNDGISEIIVGWGVSQNDLVKEMNVYMTTNIQRAVEFKSVFNDTYYDFKTVDVNSDGVTDILKVNYNSALEGTEFKLVLLSYEDFQITEKSSIALDRAFSAVTNITYSYSKTTDETTVYVDGFKFESGMATDCVRWNNQSAQFVKDLRRYPPIGAVSSRSTNIKCYDINGDKIIEIPTEEEIPASEVIVTGTDAPKKQKLIKWVQLENYGYKNIQNTILNLNYSYGVKINDDIPASFTVVNNQTTGMLTFYKLDYTVGQPAKGEALFSIKAVEAVDNDAFLNYKYKFMTKNRNYYYYCRIYEAGEAANLTKNKITKLLFFDFS